MKRGCLLLILLLVCSGCAGSARNADGSAESPPVSPSAPVTDAAPVSEAPSPDVSAPASPTPFNEALFTEVSQPPVMEDVPPIDGALSEPSYIDPALLTLLSEAVLDGTYGDVLEGMAVPELSRDEAQELLSSAETLRGFYAEDYDSIRHFYRLTDSRGQDTLFAYSGGIGGTSGISSVEIFLSKDGAPFKRSWSDAMWDFFHCFFTMISYEGQTYFAHEYYDYSRKSSMGLEIYAFVDGHFAELVTLERYPRSHSLRTKGQPAAPYAALRATLTEQAHGWYMTLCSEHMLTLTGSAEIQLSEQEFRCDLNNDGQEEIYEKDLYLPGNRSGRRGLQTQPYYSDLLGLTLDAEDKLPQLLWVDEVNGKNIVCVLSQKLKRSELTEDPDGDSFFIDTYLIEGSRYTQLDELWFVPDYVVRTAVYTHGKNIDYSIEQQY